MTQSIQQNPDDVVITLAVRTPMAKAARGGLKDTTLDDMVFKLLEQVRQRSSLEPHLVNDICLGNVCEHTNRAPAITFLRSCLFVPNL